MTRNQRSFTWLDKREPGMPHIHALGAATADRLVGGIALALDQTYICHHPFCNNCQAPLT